MPHNSSPISSSIHNIHRVQLAFYAAPDPILMGLHFRFTGGGGTAGCGSKRSGGGEMK